MKTTISIMKCKIVGPIYWNGFINNFMKEIHIIEIKPYIFLYKLHLSRIIPVRRDPL